MLQDRGGFPREDLISLDMSELNFAKKRRGKKTSSINHVPENLSKRHCVSKVGKIFDFTGIVTPLVAGMKIELHELTNRKRDWDDILPINVQELWKSHDE